ncbi:pumilio homolog 3-like [Eriocheir sinensis]|uniref:pumilio homolog 3-like n=1 Tax=Eriocheir sinensis TaxID=95602 RepID=UPI0021C57BE1|nr:pumilio homolog 3-like [Eriocheir sinensis]XP_050711051.1 pumilio homolog 3-like [Eriocheir sinensis]
MQKSKKKNTDTNDEIRQFKAMKQDEYKTSKTAAKDDEDGGVKAILDTYGKKGAKRKPEEEDSSEKKDWKKLKAEKKELKMKRKEKNLGSSERYELSVQTKKIWEELRQANCKKERQKELCKELMSKVQGKLKAMIYAHDTVRVIETLLAKGGEEYRTLVFEELKDDLVSLSKIKYSRFFVLKILRYGSRAQKDHVISSLKGQVVKLMKHKTASDVVELAFNDYANAKQRSMMIQEFFGPQFRLFHEDDIKCLDDALKKHPEMKEYILKDLRTALQPIIDKGVFTNTMVHTLMKDFLSHCSVGDRNGVIEALKESLVPIIHTRDGARVAMLCLWHGTNKDRKTILKSFRTHFVKIATEEHGHMVLLAAFDCVDDTQFMKKVVLSELMDELDKLVGSDYGLRVLRYLIAPRSPTFYQPSVLAVLAQGDGNQASKKDTDIRQRELQGVVSLPILRLLLGNLEHWAVNPNWTLFIGAAVKTLVGPERDTIFHKLAEMYAQPYIPGTEGHVLELAHTTKMVTYIIKCDKERHETQQVTFSSVLIKKAEEELVGWTNCNRGCFLLTNMMETEIPEIVSHIKNLITPHKSNLEKQKFAGAQVLLKKI